MSFNELFFRTVVTLISAFVCLVRLEKTEGDSGIGWWLFSLLIIWT